MPSLADRTKNRYLLWLEKGATPPVRGSMAKAKEAAAELAAEILRAKRCLVKPHATWAHWERFCLGVKRLNSLLGLVQCQASISRRLTPEKAQAWEMEWDRWKNRVIAPMTQGHWRNHLLVLAHHEGTDVALRDVRAFMEYNGPDTADVLLLQKQKLQQEKRDKDYVKDRLVRGGVHADALPGGVTREWAKKAKAAGAARGNVPYLFLPFTAESAAALVAAEQADFRRLLWLEDAHAPVPTLAVEKRRATRQALAEAENHAHFADHMLRDQAIYPQPEKLIHALRQARKRLRPEAMRLRKIMRDYTNARFPDMDPATEQPWDRQLVITEGNPLYQWCDTQLIFPWRETALKIFSELLPACGWTYSQPPVISGEGTWSAIHFQIERQSDGRKAHLFYSPFRPHQAGNSEYSAGEAFLFHTGWTPQNQVEDVACLWINQALDPDTQAYNQEELRVVCHEIGHALHYFSLPYASFTEAWIVPSDLMEIPSHLLELYPRDPAVLARWASRKGPPAARRARFWKNKLALAADVLFEHQNSLRSAEADLRLCLAPGESLRSICQDLYAGDGLPFLEEDGSWRRLFIWEESYACQDYTQCLPPGIVRRLVTLTDRGTVNADHIAATYNSLLTEVLETGITADQAARNWKQWTGETFATTIHQSLLGHAQQVARVGRKEVSKIRKKLVALRRKRRPA